MNPWIAAARPRTLPAAVVPVLVGAASAVADDSFDWRAGVLSFLGALAIQVAANFANDVSDAARAADPVDRLGPPRMVAAGVISPGRMWRATWIAIGVAALCGVGLTMLAGPVVLLVGAASIVALLGYVGGPFPYGYRGLGEVSVFIFFGLVATAGSRYVHDRRIPMTAWVAAIPVGLIAVAILVINNLRDLDTDARVGKRTLAVIMGERPTRLFYLGLLIAAFGVVAGATVLAVLPLASLVVAASLPLALHLARQVMRGGPLPPLLAATARFHLVFGVLLAASLALG